MLEYYQNNRDYLLQGKPFTCPESSILPWKTLTTFANPIFEPKFPEKRMVYQVCESKGISFFVYQHPLTKDIVVVPNFTHIIKVFNVHRKSKFVYTIVTSKDAYYRSLNLFEPLLV